MCGRYTVLTEDEIIQIREILKDLSLRISRDDFRDQDYTDTVFEGEREVFPTDLAPVITQASDGVVFENAKWGFSKWNGPGVIINARSETIAQKGMFAKHLMSGRCVVPAGEFFEWEKLDKGKSASGKRKYYAKDKHGNLLFMAGLYRDVMDQPGQDAQSQKIREFVIITKESTGSLAKIHDRMPVILRVEQIEPWLTGALTPDDIVNMEYDVFIAPCDDDISTDSLEQISLF